jgi:hypothetical protein
MSESVLTENVKKKWGKILESEEHAPINDRYKKNVTTRLLENTLQFLKETTNTTSGIDNIDPVLINLVRRIAPNLMAYEIVGVQPMTGPSGLIFALRAHYGDQPKGPHGRPGDGRKGFEAGSDLDSHDKTTAQGWGDDGKAPNEALYNEADTTFSGTGTQSANDGSVDYGVYSVGGAVDLAAGETMGRGETGDLDFNAMSVTIDKTHVVAGTRGLEAHYTHELSHDLRAVHGLDAETELTNLLSTELQSEINREIVNTVRQIAKVAPGEQIFENGTALVDSNGAAVLGSAGLFDLNVNSDGRHQAEKFKTLLFKINKEANAIAKDTRRGRGNLIICSSDVASALDLAGKLDYAPAVENNLPADDTGNTFVGVLQGRYRVYIDPYLGYDEIIVGYKGQAAYDAGMFYCPYVPLQLHKAQGENDYQPRIAFKTRYGIVANPFTTMKRNSNLYYRKFMVKGL